MNANFYLIDLSELTPNSDRHSCLYLKISVSHGHFSVGKDFVEKTPIQLCTDADAGQMRFRRSDPGSSDAAMPQPQTSRSESQQR